MLDGIVLRGFGVSTGILLILGHTLGSCLELNLGRTLDSFSESIIKTHIRQRLNIVSVQHTNTLLGFSSTFLSSKMHFGTYISGGILSE